MFIAFCCLYIPATATIRYVKPVASGSGSGSSWGNASDSFQGMIDASAAGDTVWVAGGIYKPTACTTCRDSYFRMKEGVAIYGGFEGTEAATYNLDLRDFVAHPSVLSGDIDGDDSPANNSFHVMFNNNNQLTDAALLDGFTIKGGNANGSNDERLRGGGIFNYLVSPRLSHCLFTDNHASRGGGIFNLFASPNLSHCIFSGNSASLGGGVYNFAASPKFSHCTFSGNSAGSGGGIYNSSIEATSTLQ